MQRFVLTPEEKRVLIFILSALLLGLVAKCYRAEHASVAGPPYQSDYHPAGQAPSPISAKKPH